MCLCVWLWELEIEFWKCQPATRENKSTWKVHNPRGHYNLSVEKYKVLVCRKMV